jgi:hypothetical protein
MALSSAKQALIDALEAGNFEHEVRDDLFRPTIAGVRWYVKAYFLEEPEGTAVFISVHR